MSTVAEIPEAIETAGRLVELVSEYADKLSKAKEKALSVEIKPTGFTSTNRPPTPSLRIRDLSDYLRYVRPPAEQLIRQSSQLVEHGAIDDTTRLELRLRLAELEHALLSTTTIVNQMEKSGA